MLKTALFSFCRRIEKVLQYICLLFLLLLILTSCGRKAPPILPKMASPPQIRDLSVQIQKNNIELKWSLAAESITEYPEIKGFYVYQAVTTKKEQACEKCPRKFERIGEIMPVPYMDLPDGRRQWQYKTPVDSRLKYAFKVNILFSKDLGPNSNIVEIEP